MIEKATQGKIKALLQSPQWPAIEELMENLIKRIEQNSTVRDTEWDTIKATLSQEGQVEGIRALLKELYEVAR